MTFLVYYIKKEGVYMIERPYYLELLKTYRDVTLVKVLAGIRRCGKSTILTMLHNDLMINLSLIHI